MSEHKQLEKVKECLRWFETFDPESIAHVGTYGTKSNKIYTKGVPLAAKLRAFYCTIPNRVAERLHQDALEQLFQHLTQDRAKLEKAINFKEDGNTRFIETEDTTIQQIEVSYSSASMNLSAKLVFAVVMDLDIQKELGLVQEQTKLIPAELSKIKTEVEPLITVMRKVTGDAAVGHQAEHFLKESQKQNLVANWWSAGVLILAVSILITAIAFIPGDPTADQAEEKTSYTIRHSISKIVLFSILFSTLYICVKNMSACRHNAVVNKHRYNALSTYEAIVAADKDEKSRSVILAYAAGCIFSPQPTGYSGADAMDTFQAGAILDLVNKIKSGGSSI